MSWFTPAVAQGSAGWLNSFSFSCTSFIPLPSSSFSSTDPANFLPSSSSSNSFLFLSSSSWVTLFNQACGAETEAVLGAVGAELPVSSFQAMPSSDDNLAVQKEGGRFDFHEINLRFSYVHIDKTVLRLFIVLLGSSSVCFILTHSPAARQTFSHLGCACESVCVSVCACRPPAPSVSVSAAGCGFPAAPAKHHGIQEGTAMRRKWDQRTGRYGLPLTTNENTTTSSRGKFALVRWLRQAPPLILILNNVMITSVRSRGNFFLGFLLETEIQVDTMSCQVRSEVNRAKQLVQYCSVKILILSTWT